MHPVLAAILVYLAIGLILGIVGAREEPKEKGWEAIFLCLFLAFLWLPFCIFLYILDDDIDEKNAESQTR